MSTSLHRKSLIFGVLGIVIGTGGELVCELVSPAAGVAMMVAGSLLFIYGLACHVGDRRSRAGSDRVCPDCRALVPEESRHCPECSRYVSGHAESASPDVGVAIWFSAWVNCWPLSMLFGVPDEAREDVSWRSLAGIMFIALVVGSALVMIVLLVMNVWQ